MNTKLDVRTRTLLDATKAVEVKRNNRNKNAQRTNDKAKALADAKRPAKEALRAARRETWDAWKERRELARRLAKRGLYVLPPAAHGPGTRSCCACGVCQSAAAFGEARQLCATCIPQEIALARALDASHAARARARQPLMERLSGLSSGAHARAAANSTTLVAGSSAATLST